MSLTISIAVISIGPGTKRPMMRLLRSMAISSPPRDSSSSTLLRLRAKVVAVIVFIISDCIRFYVFLMGSHGGFGHGHGALHLQVGQGCGDALGGVIHAGQGAGE